MCEWKIKDPTAVISRLKLLNCLRPVVRFTAACSLEDRLFLSSFLIHILNDLPVYCLLFIVSLFILFIDSFIYSFFIQLFIQLFTVTIYVIGMKYRQRFSTWLRREKVSLIIPSSSLSSTWSSSIHSNYSDFLYFVAIFIGLCLVEFKGPSSALARRP